MSKNKNKHRNVSQNNQTLNETNNMMVDDSASSNNESDVVEEIEVEESNELLEEEIVSESDEYIDEIIEENHTDSVTLDNTLEETVETTDEQITRNDENPTEPEPVRQTLMLYKVGTDFNNGKCVNQVIITADLSAAKEECLKARNTHKKAYYVFNKEGRPVYSAEYTIPKDTYFRVGTDWRNSICINQKEMCTNFDNACTSANNNTKLTGVIHHVYDPSGKIVFSAKKKLILLSYKKRGIKNADWYTK